MTGLMCAASNGYYEITKLLMPTLKLQRTSHSPSRFFFTVNVFLQLSLSSDTVCGYYNGFENHLNIRVTEEPHIVIDFGHHKVVAYLHYNGDLSGKPMVSKRS